jgi:hypothetical protein
MTSALVSVVARRSTMISGDRMRPISEPPRDVADFQPVIAPGDRTVLGRPDGRHAWHAWPLP